MTHPLLQRCDSLRPSCSNCSRTDRECEYAPILNTIEKLEDRVQELQAQILQRLNSQMSQSDAPGNRFRNLGRSIQSLRPPPLQWSPTPAEIPQSLLTWYSGNEVPLRLRYDLFV